MSLNVEQITSRLAQMPDAALQKYAAMNKNDPYIMALAVSESNRRKQMRQAAQAQQGQMQQPKVVDAAVQSMAQPMPEDTGIARLPAGNMNFADGGIVAFADGGEVERYQTGGTIMPALMAQYEREAQEMGEGRRTQFSPELKPVVEQLQAPRRAAEQSYLQREQAQMLQGPALLNRSALPVSSAPAAPVAAPAKQRYQLEATGQRLGYNSDVPDAGNISNIAYYKTADGKLMALPRTTPQGYRLTDAEWNAEKKRYNAENAPTSQGPGDVFVPRYPQGGTTPQQNTTAPKADATRRVVPGAPKAPTAAPAATATQDAGLAALDPAKMFEAELKKQRGETRPEKEMLEQLNKDRKSAAEQELASERALEKRFADAYRGRRERLTEREGELGKMKDQNFGLALLQAGAAMMSTRGNVGTAIGKGIQAGSQQYVAGIDKLNAARDKLADARDRLDDLQLNRDEMSARSIQKAENKIRDTAIAGQENMIRYIMERDKVDRDTAAKIVDSNIQIGLTKIKEEGMNVRSQNEIQGRITAAGIAAQPALERNAMLRLANSKDDKVRTEYGKLQAKVMDTLSKDDNYKMATPAQQQVMQTNALRQALLSNPFLSAYAANIGFSSTPAGGKVYDLTED